MPYENLAEDFVSRDTIERGRKVWTQSPPSVVPSALLLFLDAELYIERVKAPEVLRSLQEAGSLPPTRAVYVSHNGAAARHTDYTCSTDYAAFIAQEVLPWALRDLPAIDRERTVIVGLSLSGLEAAFIARQYPARFRAALCQSPSFWWENERFRQSIPPPDPAQPTPEFWISVGDQENEKGVSHPPSGLRQDSTQIESCQRTADALQACGYPVRYRLFDGGHDPNCWRDDLAMAVPAVLGTGR